MPANYELQKEFLDEEQRRISAELFESGVTSRIAGVAKIATGALVEVTGLGQLDKLFVPSLGKVRQGDREEQELSLVAITADDAKQSRSFSYLKLGRIDSAGILFPYPGIPIDDADIVHSAALQLVQAKQEGLLPNLNYDLLSVHNPRQAITTMRPSEDV